MPLKIVKDNITAIRCDAIVSTVDVRMKPVSPIGDLKAKIPNEIVDCCKKINARAVKVGDAVVSPSLELDCNLVIHTVLPEAGMVNEAAVCSCYKNALAVAKETNCSSIALPFIAPTSDAATREKLWRVAKNAVRDFLADHEMTIYLVAPKKEFCNPGKKLLDSVKKYISNVESSAARSDNGQAAHQANFSATVETSHPNVVKFWTDGNTNAMPANYAMSLSSVGLDSMLRNLDKGFRDTLFYYIDKKGLSDVECYKRSNIDKKTFSKIRSNENYRPSKVTAVSFAVGLHLDMDETEHLLSTAGMCLSHSNKFDVIIEYFIANGAYETIFDVNEVLYQFDQSLLGV